MYPSPSPYVSGHSRATIVKVLLIAGAAIDLLSMIVAGVELIFPPFSGQQEASDNPGGFAIALLSLGLGLVTFAIFVATVVVFLLWLHRCYKNLPAFGTLTSSLTQSPGWTIGSFFVPFANLVIPYRGIKELWQKSAPANTPFMSVTSPPAWFGVWWAFWLASNFATNLYVRASFNETFSRDTLAIVSIIADGLSIIASIFAIQVISAIDRRQEEAGKGLGSQFSGPPMPPSSFGSGL